MSFGLHKLSIVPPCYRARRVSRKVVVCLPLERVLMVVCVVPLVTIWGRPGLQVGAAVTVSIVLAPILTMTFMSWVVIRRLRIVQPNVPLRQRRTPVLTASCSLSFLMGASLALQSRVSAQF